MVEQEAEYTVLYDYVLNRLVTCGITKEEFNSLKKHPIGHRSVEGFINANIKIGNFEWLNGKLVNVDRQSGQGRLVDKYLLFAERSKL